MAARITLACLLALALPACYPDQAGEGRTALTLDLAGLGVDVDSAGLSAWLGWLAERDALGQLSQPLEFDLDPATAPFYLDLALVGRAPYGEPLLVGDGVSAVDLSTLDVSVYIGPCAGCTLELLLFAADPAGQVTTFTGASAEFDIEAFGAPRSLDLDAYPLRTGSLLVRGVAPGQILAAQDAASEVRFPRASSPTGAAEVVIGSIPAGRPFNLQAEDGGRWVTRVRDLTVTAGEQRIVQLP